MAGEPEPELDAVLAETLAFTTVRPEGDGWIGDTPPWFGDYLFGGFVVAQAVHAATRTAPAGRRIHSLHAYFLRPVRAGPPVAYAVTPIRDGRTFASRRLEATQSGEPVLTMTCSFAADTEGYEYELPGAPDLPRPDADDLETSTGPGPWRAPRGSDPRSPTPTAHARRRTASGSRGPRRCPTIRICMRRSSGSRPTGPGPVDGLAIWTVTHGAWSASTMRCGSTGPRASTSGSSTTCTHS